MGQNAAPTMWNQGAPGYNTQQRVVPVVGQGGQVRFPIYVPTTRGHHPGAHQSYDQQHIVKTDNVIASCATPKDKTSVNIESREQEDKSRESDANCSKVQNGVSVGNLEKQSTERNYEKVVSVSSSVGSLDPHDDSGATHDLAGVVTKEKPRSQASPEEYGTDTSEHLKEKEERAIRAEQPEVSFLLEGPSQLKPPWMQQQGAQLQHQQLAQVQQVGMPGRWMTLQGHWGTPYRQAYPQVLLGHCPMQPVLQPSISKTFIPISYTSTRY
ncbi:MAG: hypothetical protein AB2693_32845 [Candidatus Thiodiazotropha sp.]